MTIPLQFEFRSYRRSFRQPLQTHHGHWCVRDGIIIRLANSSGETRYGEIAPIQWFGSETIDEAIAFCKSLPAEIDAGTIANIPDTLPACQFGFESALNAVRSNNSVSQCALLPTGIAACNAWDALYYQGFQTFKLKIGAAAIAEELSTLKTLLSQLPDHVRLRLDANAGLTQTETQRWLEICDNFNVEFLEQPLSIDQFETMLELSYRYKTPIALDESVATLNQLKDCYDRGWRGIFVIKPAIAGFPSRLRQFCQQHQIDAVFSSVFETAIARQAGLQLSADLSRRAAGYGTLHWFDTLKSDDFETVWQSL